MNEPPADGTDPDLTAMRRALAEAQKGHTSPNPHVGAILTRDGEVIAVGHHERAGLAHAEVAAITSAGGAARGATLYCTLTPCNHVGRTGPCTEAILNAGIRRVVIGAADPAPHVPGAVERLRAAGVEVREGVLEDACRRLIADFTRHIQTGLPYVVLKGAVTLDGRMATRTTDSRWITGVEARTEAHRMRDRADAVLVGVGTVLADDPALTVRHVEGEDPRRIVLDTHLRTPPGARVLADGGRTTIFHGPETAAERRRALESAGAELVEVALDEHGLSLDAVLGALGASDVMRLLVEGGPSVHGALLRGGWVQRAAVFVAPKILGDPEAPSLALVGPRARMDQAFVLRDVETRRFGVDTLVEGELDPTSGGGYE